MHTYFLSDLHLNHQQPHITAAFIRFLNEQAPSAESIYILGDLFEYWIGDDAIDELDVCHILSAMHKLSQKVRCYFIAGNRDFLVRQRFSQQTGFTILADETVIDLYGTPTLILHGDSLCVDDIKHQQFRQNFVLNKMVCDLVLTKPVKERLQLAQQARAKSQSNKRPINDQIMDVSESAVIAAFKKHKVMQMIHGHTHRQKLHSHELGNATASRHVLGDWHSSSSILTASATGLSISNSPIG